MYNILMTFTDISDIVKTKEEKKILQKLLIAYRSFLIRREREKREQERAANARFFLENSLVGDSIRYFKYYGKYVRVRYNKTSIIKGKIVGHPNENRERFCLEWYDEEKKETRRKYFPFTAIVAYKTVYDKGVKLNIKPKKYQLSVFDFEPYSEYPQFVEYIKNYIEAPERNISARDKIENALFSLIRDVKITDKILLETIRKNEEAYWENLPREGSKIVFLHNRKEAEGKLLLNVGSSGKYMKVKSDAIMTKNHIKYIPIGYFCRIINDSETQE